MKGIKFFQNFIQPQPSVEVIFDNCEYEEVTRILLRDRTKFTRKVPVFRNLREVSGKVVVKYPGKKVPSSSVVKYEFVGEINIKPPHKQTSKFISIVKDEISCNFTPYIPPHDLIDENNKNVESNNNSPTSPTMSKQCAYKFKYIVNRENLYNSFSGRKCSVDYFVVVSINNVELKRVKFNVRNRYKKKQKTSGSFEAKMQIKEHFFVNCFVEKKHFNIHSDKIIGTLKFLEVKKRVKNIFAIVLRKEILVKKDKNGKSIFFKKRMCKFEILDGECTVGDVIPLRMYLKSIPKLTPSFGNINKMFRVKYYLQIQVKCKDEKKYYKNIPLTFFQK